MSFLSGYWYSVGSLWLQELFEEEEILFCKVPGAENIADILTKHVGASLLDKHAANMGIFFPSGRAESGLHLQCQCNFEPHAVASWQCSLAQPWLHLRRRSVKPSRCTTFISMSP